MLRKIAAVLAGAVVASTLMVGATPANADTKACVGTGTANTGALIPFGTPDVATTSIKGTAASTTFGFNISSTTGACVPGGSLQASGTVNANASCAGGSTGSGVTVQGSHSFTFQVVGAVLVARGGINAAAIIVPDPVAGQLCTPVTPGVNQFTLVGAEVEPGVL